jgi:hypothetical protein
MFREGHLWNVGVLQSVHPSSHVITQDRNVYCCYQLSVKTHKTATKLKPCILLFCKICINAV